jgi:hypothetical protein
MRYSTNSNFKDKDDNNVMNNYNVMYITVPVMITEISCQDSEVSSDNRYTLLQLQQTEMYTKQCYTNL